LIGSENISWLFNYCLKNLAFIFFSREVPSALVARPIIVASDAAANVIEGVKGSVAPDIRKEEEEKWKGPQHNRDYDH